MSVKICKYVYIHIYTQYISVCNCIHKNPDDGVRVYMCKCIFIYTNVI